ncbi:Rv3212 family protein [Corynebacterium flavescens]|uniref:Rv3212 family protein n=1 Tax=Corynebacterium flavescens TaxID=28028 RepID=UPI003FD5990A
MSPAPILRDSPRDWKAAFIIVIVCAVAVVGAFSTASIRHSHLTQQAAPGTPAESELSQAPAGLGEDFRLSNQLTPGNFRAVTAAGLLITHEGSTITATTADGRTAWSYERTDVTLCSLSTAWDKVVATYRTSAGCGDVVAISAATGEYADTRSAINSPDVVSLSSNDRVGTVSSERAELWRSDLVRSVEYGDVEAPQESDMQEHADCTITSALTRTELLAVTETCPADPDSTWLRLQETTPEDSRKPEVEANIEVDNSGAKLVAVGQKAAAVFIPGPSPEIVAYDRSGNEISRSAAQPAPLDDGASIPFAPATADLPHNVSWFDGERLYLFTPSDLHVDRVLGEAIGTPVAAGPELLVPVPEGIAVVDASNGSTRYTIPVDRGDYRGAVYLSLAGESIIEQRGDVAVALSAR